MRFLIVRNVPPDYTLWLYSQHAGLEKRSFDEQLRAYAENPYLIADSYSHNLRRLGHEAIDVIPNSEILQRTWAEENDMRIRESRPFRTLMGRFPRVLRAVRRFPGFLGVLLATLIESYEPTWLYDVLKAQIRDFEPDILMNLAMDELSPSFMASMKSHAGMLVGQFGWPLPPAYDYRCYDLFLSALPNVVAQGRRLGIRSEVLPLGFDPRVLSRLNNSDRKFPVSFIGNLSRGYPWEPESYLKGRLELLESLCNEVPIRIWGYEPLATDPSSPVRKVHMGPVWGIRMFQTLRDSKVALNVHGSHHGPFASNVRLYETTGVGSLLVTDDKANLHEIFEPDKEVVVYRNPTECVRLVRYYLEHDAEREAIASAGQKRTLRDHTYEKRMLRLLDLLS